MPNVGTIQYAVRSAPLAPPKVLAALSAVSRCAVARCVVPGSAGTRRSFPSADACPAPLASSARDKNGNVAVPVGKFSFSDQQLTENGAAVIDAVVKARPASAKGRFVDNVTLAATMLPGITVDASQFLKS